MPLFAVLSELANKYKYAQLVATVDYLLRTGKNTCNQERKSSDLCFLCPRTLQLKASLVNVIQQGQVNYDQFSLWARGASLPERPTETARVKQIRNLRRRIKERACLDGKWNGDTYTLKRFVYIGNIINSVQ